MGQGITYIAFRQILKNRRIVSGICDVCNCGDNAAEGLFGKLNRERVYRRRYLTPEDARADASDYIERLHNPIIQRRRDAKIKPLDSLPTRPWKRGRSPA